MRYLLFLQELFQVLPNYLSYMRSKTIQSNVEVSENSIPLQERIVVLNLCDYLTQEVDTNLTISQVHERIETCLEVVPKPSRMEKLIIELTVEMGEFNNLNALLGLKN